MLSEKEEKVQDDETSSEKEASKDALLKRLEHQIDELLKAKITTKSLK